MGFERRHKVHKATLGTLKRLDVCKLLARLCQLKSYQPLLELQLRLSAAHASIDFAPVLVYKFMRCIHYNKSGQEKEWILFRALQHSRMHFTILDLCLSIANAV